MGGPTRVPQIPGVGNWGMSSTESECAARVYRRSELVVTQSRGSAPQWALLLAIVPDSQAPRVRATSLQRVCSLGFRVFWERTGPVAAAASGKGWGRASAGRWARPPAGARSGCWMPGAGVPAERRGPGASPTRASRARLLLEKAVSLAGGGRRPLPLRLGLTPVWR